MKKLIKKECGLHYGKNSGPCSKCGYFAKLDIEKPFYTANINALNLINNNIK